MLCFHVHRITHLAVREKLIDWTEDSTKYRRPSSRKPSTPGSSRRTTRCARPCIKLETSARCRGRTNFDRNTYHAMSYVSYVHWKRRKPRYVLFKTFWLAQKLHLWLNGIHWHGPCSASAIVIFQKGCVLSEWCSQAWNWSVFESSWRSRALFMKFSQALFAFMLHSILFNIVLLEFTIDGVKRLFRAEVTKRLWLFCKMLQHEEPKRWAQTERRSHWHTFDLSHSILFCIFGWTHLERQCGTPCPNSVSEISCEVGGSRMLHYTYCNSTGMKDYCHCG